MSKSFNHRNKNLNDTLMNCKGGVHEQKSGKQMKRSRQAESFHRDMKNQRWQEV